MLSVLLLIGTPLDAQVISSRGSAERVAAAVDTRLDLAHLQRLRCASRGQADCPGGLQVVQYCVFPGTMRGDTAWIPVQMHVLGVVASSEASLMFLPDRDPEHLDGDTITVIRRGTRWIVGAVGSRPEQPRTSVTAAKQFFHFDADERRRLDSAAGAPRPSCAAPRNR